VSRATKFDASDKLAAAILLAIIAWILGVVAATPAHHWFCAI
jgi:hypothetical protein